MSNSINGLNNNTDPLQYLLNLQNSASSGQARLPALKSWGGHP